MEQKMSMLKIMVKLKSYLLKGTLILTSIFISLFFVSNVFASNIYEQLDISNILDSRTSFNVINSSFGSGTVVPFTSTIDNFPASGFVYVGFWVKIDGDFTGMSDTQVSIFNDTNTQCANAYITSSDITSSNWTYLSKSLTVLNDCSASSIFHLEFYKLSNNSYTAGTGHTYANSLNEPYVQLSFDSLPNDPTDYSTHIISFQPENEATTTNPVTFALSAYINPDDIAGQYAVRLTLHNIDQNIFVFSGLSPYDIYFLDNYSVESSGLYNFSTTTILAEGNYSVEAEIGSYFAGGWVWNPFSSINNHYIHKFTVGQPTFIGNITQNSWQAMGLYASGTSATSTTALAGTCNPFSGSVSTLYFNPEFSPLSCLTFLFVPDLILVNASLTNFKDNVSTHFPMGYFTQMYGILSTTTTRSLPVISATIPSGVIGAGAHIDLDVSHSLDFILNATTSQFINASASSTQTFYEITSYYWNIFVWLALAFYLLSRVLGSRIIGGLSGMSQEEVRGGVGVYKAYLDKNK